MNMKKAGDKQQQKKKNAGLYDDLAGEIEGHWNLILPLTGSLVQEGSLTPKLAESLTLSCDLFEQGKGGVQRNSGLTQNMDENGGSSPPSGFGGPSRARKMKR